MILKYADLAPNWENIKKKVEGKLDRTTKQISVGKESQDDV